MNPLEEHVQATTRRHFFGRTSMGLGTAALASLLPDQTLARNIPSSSADPMLGLSHYAPKAKRAIYLFMAGAPCQIDMFDYKPKVEGMFDKDLAESMHKFPAKFEKK